MAAARVRAAVAVGRQTGRCPPRSRSAPTPPRAARMPSKSGCSPVTTRRPPRSAWWSDKDARDSSAHPTGGSGIGIDGSAILEPGGPRPNGQCHHHHSAAPNGHCATGNTLPGETSRGASDHVIISGEAEAGCPVTDVDTPGCFACITLCHAKDSRKSSK